MAAADVHGAARTAAGAGASAGAGAPESLGAPCRDFTSHAHDTGATRQWRQGKRWALFNVDSEAGSCDADASFDGDAVFVHELATGRVVRLAVTASDKGVSVKAKACKLLGVTVDTSAFVFKGRMLGDNEPVSSILEAGGHVGVAQVGVVLEFDPSAKNEHVELSDNNKEMWSNHPSYCSGQNQVRVTEPFPSSGKSEFVVQLSGTETGCYDAIGLVTEEHDVVSGEQRIGYDVHSWSWELSNGRTRHARRGSYMNDPGYCSSGDVLHFCLDNDAHTLTLHRYRGSAFTHDSPLEIFSGLPSDPLYLAVQTCGHEGRPKLRIIDDSSPVADVGGAGSDGTEYE